MTLEIANKVYTMEDYKILQEFSQTAEKDFLSAAQSLDFGNSEAARQTINSWVEEKTRNKIKDLIPSDLSMFVILPNKIDGIKELEEKLVKTDLTKLLYNLPNVEVVVTMPKFKLEEKTDFNEILKELGMVTMFNQGQADFSGISGKNELYVSKVLQKAFIEVNEEGSEAAAATGESSIY
ncbi:hypothetical protein C0J52_10761 [Blattella germanica]|nr:hypothetical protein C0J52_10761 [Blattella germanica]